MGFWFYEAAGCELPARGIRPNAFGYKLTADS
jgi:hypothetical protein